MCPDSLIRPMAEKITQLFRALSANAVEVIMSMFKLATTGADADDIVIQPTVPNVKFEENCKAVASIVESCNGWVAPGGNLATLLGKPPDDDATEF
eukprot:6965099-Alexandrium_andersonii.AAC.1